MPMVPTFSDGTPVTARYTQQKTPLNATPAPVTPAFTSISTARTGIAAPGTPGMPRSGAAEDHLMDFDEWLKQHKRNASRRVPALVPGAQTPMLAVTPRMASAVQANLMTPALVKGEETPGGITPFTQLHGSRGDGEATPFLAETPLLNGEETPAQPRDPGFGHTSLVSAAGGEFGDFAKGAYGKDELASLAATPAFRVADTPLIQTPLFQGVTPSGTPGIITPAPGGFAGADTPLLNPGDGNATPGLRVHASGEETPGT